MVQRSRNLCLYPNVYLMDQFSSQIRHYRPIAVDKTEVTNYCIAPQGLRPSCRAGSDSCFYATKTAIARRSACSATIRTSVTIRSSTNIFTAILAAAWGPRTRPAGPG
jgi:hypothetical protein